MRSTSRCGPSPVRSGRGFVMPEPRLSVLIVAKNEAHNLADCLAAASWADRTDRRRRPGQPGRHAGYRPGNRPTSSPSARSTTSPASGTSRSRLASGDWVLSIDADERVTPALAAEIRRVMAEPANPYHGFRVPIRSVILGRAFGFSGTQHDQPLRLFRRDSRPLDRPGSRDGRAERRRRDRCKMHSGITRFPMCRSFFDKLDHYTTLEAAGLAGSDRPLPDRAI